MKYRPFTYDADGRPRKMLRAFWRETRKGDIDALGKPYARKSIVMCDRSKAKKLRYVGRDVVYDPSFASQLLRIGHYYKLFPDGKNAIVSTWRHHTAHKHKKPFPVPSKLPSGLPIYRISLRLRYWVRSRYFIVDGVMYKEREYTITDPYRCPLVRIYKDRHGKDEDKIHKNGGKRTKGEYRYDSRYVRKSAE